MLSPYRALDLTDEKGLLCGKILADLGAEVIQVESPSGNPARKIPPFARGKTDPEHSLFWYAFSAGKKSVTLDMEVGNGRDNFKKLAGTADFLIESFPPGYLDSIGLGYQTLSSINPALIMVSISPFGQTGPYRDYKAGDLVSTAMGGMAYCTGEVDRPPIRISLDQTYSQASVHAAAGILIALNQRSKIGRGQWIDVSMQASVVRTLHTQLPYWEYSNKIVERSGIQRFRGGVSTQEIWPCKDGFVSWMFFGGAVGTRQMQYMVEWMDSKGMAGSLTEEIQDWSSLDLTKVSPNKIRSWEQLIGDFFMNHTKLELYEEAVEKRIPLTPLNDVSDVLEDNQLIDRKFWTNVAYTDLDTEVPYPGFLFITSDEECQPAVKGRAPRLGENNDDIYQELKELDEESIHAVLPGGNIPDNKRDLAALEGLRVVDFSWAFAGPFIGSYLGDYGANIIKIESNSNLDITRVTSPYKDGISGINRSGCFLVANNSKMSLTLDLKNPKARLIIEKLISWADVVVENFGTGVMDRLGLNYKKLQAINPNIIMLSATIQGQTGPRASFTGYGWNTVALTGIGNLTGWPDRSPVGTLQAYPDSVVPWFGVVAILAALDYRRRTGKGQYIDISQYETTCQFLAPLVMDYAVNNNLSTRVGNQSSYSVPHGVYRCKGNDRWCAISVFTEIEREAFRKAIGYPEWTKEKRFSALQQRKENEGQLNELVEKWTHKHTPEEIMGILQKAGVPAGIVKTNKELFEDPQLKHRGYFQLIDHPEIGKCYQQGWPILLSESPVNIKPAPCLGEHNEYICTGILGLSDEEFIGLFSEGVFD
ncbi:MAG TPA: CoA transferase [Dehalococcoidia bacterium]|nr:CoA transferase [Dehalococcoidia bacterium]